MKLRTMVVEFSTGTDGQTDGQADGQTDRLDEAKRVENIIT